MTVCLCVVLVDKIQKASWKCKPAVDDKKLGELTTVNYAEQ